MILGTRDPWESKKIGEIELLKMDIPIQIVYDSKKLRMPLSIQIMRDEGYYDQETGKWRKCGDNFFIAQHNIPSEESPYCNSEYSYGFEVVKSKGPNRTEEDAIKKLIEGLYEKYEQVRASDSEKNQKKYLESILKL